MLDLVKIAKRVIAQEVEGLNALSRSIDDSFARAVDLIAGTDGKLILSGMGKSGYIARKVAATFSSTGTPAIFLHPAEASHGDLGVINGRDVVILYSNSGETHELNAIINYCRRFNVSIIGITANTNSNLANLSDIKIILPTVSEASIVDAPTTSTAMMMAVGDALAIALLEQKGFARDDFKLLHPGGAIGVKLLRVLDIMHSGEHMPLVKPHDPAAEMLIEIASKRLGCAGVINKNGELVGVVTDGDLRRHIGLDIHKSNVSDFMTPSPITINKEMLGVQALALMNKRSITSLFVLENDKPIGVIHIHDLLRAGIS